MNDEATPIIQVKGIRKRYERATAWAVDNLSFHVNRGELFSLLGPNGAGKTTTLSILGGLLAPTAGDALIDGISVTADAAEVKRRIGVVPQDIALYDDISARENLEFWGKLYGVRGRRLRARVDAMLEVAGLTEKAKERVGSFSGGMKRRLNMVVGLIHEPDVLFLDEPTVGVDPQSRRTLLDTVKMLNANGLTVVYTTHYMEEAEELSHRVGIVDRGTMVAIGSVEELRRSTGRRETIRLEVDEEILDGSAGEAELQAIDGVSRAKFSGSDGNSMFIVQVADSSALPRVVAWTESRGFRLRTMAIERPNLESAFLDLTGRGLRD